MEESRSAGQRNFRGGVTLAARALIGYISVKMLLIGYTASLNGGESAPLTPSDAEP